MNQFQVDIYGPPGSGKTLALASLYLYLTKRDTSADVEGLTGALHEQVNNLVRKKFTVSTTALYQPARRAETPGDLTVRAKWGDQKIEKVRLKVGDVELAFISHAGEELLNPDQSGFSVDRLRREFEDDPSRILLAVLNPFLCNEELARHAFRSLISTLQQAPLKFPFKKACTTAAALLFHLDLNAEEEHYAGFKKEFEELSPDVRLGMVFSRDEKDGGNEQQERVSVTPATDRKRVLAVVDQVAEVCVGLHRQYLTALGPVIKVSPRRTILVFTHIDLINLMPYFQVNHLFVVFAQIFSIVGDDLQLSQQQLACNVDLKITKDDAEPLRINKVLEESAERLFQAIMIRIQRAGDWSGAPAPTSVEPEVLPPAQHLLQQLVEVARTLTEPKPVPPPEVVVAETDRGSQADFWSEVAFHVARWVLPVVAAAVLVANWYGYGPYEWWRWVAAGVVGLTALSAGLLWWRWQFVPARWQVAVVVDKAQTLRYRPLWGPVVEAPMEDVEFSYSRLGNYLGVGWITVRKNRVRRFLASQWQRLLDTCKPDETRLHVAWWRDLGIPHMLGALLFAAALVWLFTRSETVGLQVRQDFPMLAVSGATVDIPVVLQQQSPAGDKRFVTLWSKSPYGLESTPVTVPIGEERFLAVTVPRNSAVGKKVLQVFGYDPATGMHPRLSPHELTLEVVADSEMLSLTVDGPKLAYRGDTAVVSVNVRPHPKFNGVVQLERLYSRKNGLRTDRGQLELPPKQYHVSPNRAPGEALKVTLDFPIPPDEHAEGKLLLSVRGSVTCGREPVKAEAGPVSLEIKDPFKIVIEATSNTSVTLATDKRLVLQGKVKRDPGFREVVDVQAKLSEKLAMVMCQPQRVLEGEEDWKLTLDFPENTPKGMYSIALTGWWTTPRGERVEFKAPHPLEVK